ncbi:MAG: hypothetical protein K2X41_04455 [Hyphomicrobium sp.]|nr:hypothetical protein [Hyphomicrobium sp.]
MTTSPTTTKNLPTLKIYRVIKGRTNLDKDIWTPVAVCWPHKDGSGFNVKFKFNEAPANGGEYVMRPDTPKPAHSA